MRKSVIVAAAMLAPVIWTSGPAQGEVKLASPYIDPVRGFEIRPPVGTTCSRITSANRLVSWTMRKSPSAPILWRLSLYSRTVETFKPGDDLLALGRSLVARLAATDGFKAASPRLIDAAGTKAVNMRGQTTGKIRFWQRRVWIPLGGTKFLEVRISGPDSDRDRLDDIASAVLKTLKITDPKVAKARRKAALASGASLLESITDAKLKSALNKSDQWYLYRRDDKAIGFMLTRESIAAVSGKSGCRIESWVMMTFDSKTMKLHRNMFASADRSIERWRETAAVKSASQNVRMTEVGAKNGARVDCEITVGDRKVAQKPQAAPADNYLPRGMAWLLRRIADLENSGAYAFATYNGRKGTFNLRTFTVIGSDDIELGGRKTSAVRVTDQLTAEAQAVDMWVDSSGNLLVMKTSDGLVMEAASEKSVARRFPDAGKIIRAMGR